MMPVGRGAQNAAGDRAAGPAGRQGADGRAGRAADQRAIGRALFGRIAAAGEAKAGRQRER